MGVAFSDRSQGEGLVVPADIRSAETYTIFFLTCLILGEDLFLSSVHSNKYLLAFFLITS